MFRKGDIVRCINDSDYAGKSISTSKYIEYKPILKNEIYTISEIRPGSNLIYLKEIAGGWSDNRFVLDIKTLRKQKIKKCLEKEM